MSKISLDDAEEYSDRLNSRLIDAGWRPGIDFDEWTAEEILEKWSSEDYQEYFVSETEVGKIGH